MPVVGKTGTPQNPVFIFDEGAPNPFSNFITELAEEDGIVRVGFAALSIDGDGQRKAMIVARIHIKRETAWELCRDLKGLQDAFMKRSKG